jgi:hypothetical protein
MKRVQTIAERRLSDRARAELNLLMSCFFVEPGQRAQVVRYCQLLDRYWRAKRATLKLRGGRLEKKSRHAAGLMRQAATIARDIGFVPYFARGLRAKDRRIHGNSGHPGS